MCVLTTTYLVQAQTPPLSISFDSNSAVVQLSWPSNFTAANWQLVSATNPASPFWQPLLLTPFPSNNTLLVSVPAQDPGRYFRLQKTGAGSCLFQATPPVINFGASSTLTWCRVAGFTYFISPAPGGGSGVVLGSSLVVSPTNSTVYSLIASNAQGLLLTNNAAVIVNPCGWLQISNLDVTFTIDYELAPTTASYNFSIKHRVSTTFHLHRQSATDTDAYFFGTTTSDPVLGTKLDWTWMDDREDDKTALPMVFTTTEKGGPGAPSRHDVSTLILHLTCSTYDFSYNVLMDVTEKSDFGTFAQSDGIATGAIVTRALPTDENRINDWAAVPGEYPPNAGDYFTPSSDLGKAMFTTGAVPGPTAGEADVSWDFFPAP